MQTTSVKLYSLRYDSAKTYLAATVFVIGNILLPQLCHAVPQGGVRLLPIYFFTLVGAYKYGWRVGVLTAVLSPIINSTLFGMPAFEALPAILLKSMLLAGAAGAVSSRYNRVSLLLMAGVVLFYQTFGTLCEWVMKGDLMLALQDLRIGLPGILLQIFGGWAVIRYLLRK